MIILQALFGVQIKNKKMKFYITLILFLCCALSPSIVSGENDRHAGNLETHLLEYFLYAVDEVNCTTCPIFTDYGQLLDDINANSWLKAAVRNSDKPTRNSIFKAWEILSKSGSDFAGAGLANSETLVKALAKDLRDSEALRTFLSTAPDSGVDLAQFSRRVRAWEALFDAPDLIRLNTDVLESMSKLIQHNLIDNIGGATSSHLANIHKYTALGDYLNQRMRVPITNVIEFTDVALPPFEFKSYRAIVEGLQILRQTSRLETGVVLRGRPLSGPDFDRLFGSGSPLDIPVKGFVSTTRDRAVAEAFASMGSFPGLRYRMVWKIKSKNGVDINDLSDWGENLGPLYHADAQPPIIMNQQEVLLEEGYFRKINEPTSIMENGSPKVDYDTNGEPIYWMEVELEELGTPIRQITSQ
jgi:hypothetical protein